MKLIVRWLIVAIAVAAAVWLVPGIRVESPHPWATIAIMAVVLGLVNAILRPILKLLSCPLILLTLGLFILIINAFCFWLASVVVPGFQIDGLMAAIIGGIVVSVVSFILSLFVSDGKRKDRTGSRVR